MAAERDGSDTDERPVRVLVVVVGLGTGGAERSTVDLAPYLAEAGVELVMSCRVALAEGAQGDLTEQSYRVVFAPDARWGPWVRHVRRLIRDERPDVVHTMLFDADLAGRVAALGLGVPVLTSVVNESYDRARYEDPVITPWKLEVTRHVEGFTLRHLTDHTHALTRSVARSAEERLGADPDRMTIIERGRAPERLGVRTGERRAAARAALGIDDDVPLVLCIGRQEFQKAQEVLVRAMSEVRRRVPGALLVLAGRPGAATAVIEQAIAEEGIGDAVVRTGHVDDVASLFCAADVFAFPSRFEGLGGVLLEAMTLEVPIVTTDIGPLRETVGGDEGAVLVPVDDVGALAAGIVEVLGSPERAAAFTARGRARVLDLYSIESVARRMAEMYRQVAAQGRLPARERWRPRRRHSSG